MTNRFLLIAAQVTSIIFSPFYLPVLAVAVLICFSYLRYMPWSFSAQVLLMIYIFTVLLPRIGIFTYRKVNGWTRRELSRRERRVVPYVLSITSYAALFYIMGQLRMPRFMLSIVAGALAVQVACALVNPLFKVSTHAAASGGLIGAIMAFSFLLNVDLTAMFCLSVLLSGLVCTARLILRQHTLGELFAGVILGWLCAFFTITNL